MKRAGLGAMTAIAILANGCISAREAAINEYVESLGKLSIPAPFIEVAEDPEEYESGPYLCTQRVVTQTKLFDRFPAQGAVADRIYPGALLNGDSLVNGFFSDVPLPRKPLTISTTLVQGTASAVMENPSLSSFRQAQTDLIFQGLNEGQENPPKFADVFVSSAISADELSLNLGFDVSAGVVSSVDVAGQFSFNTQNKRSRYLVKIVNELYTVNIDKPAFASDFFTDDVTAEDLLRRFGQGNPPVYVDSVTYGRTIYIAVESDLSSQELQATLDAAAKTVGFEGTLEFGLSVKEALEQTTIKAVVIGGSDEDFTDLRDLQNPEAWQRLVGRIVRVTNQNFGQPIAFTVGYLADSSTTVSYASGSFTAEDCNRATQSFVVRADALRMNNVNDGNIAVINGTIKVSSGSSTAEIFRSNGSGILDSFSIQQGQTRSGDSSSFFNPGLLENVSLQSGSEVTVEIDWVVNDSTLKRTFKIPAQDLLSSLVELEIIGAGINATLLLSFEAFVTL